MLSGHGGDLYGAFALRAFRGYRVVSTCGGTVNRQKILMITIDTPYKRFLVDVWMTLNIGVVGKLYVGSRRRN